MTKSPVLIVGASGFVGRHVCVALEAAGYIVRRGTSNRARCQPDSHRVWVHLDMNDPSTYANAMNGCQSVVYLFHGLGSGSDYATREAQAAVHFRDMAIKQGIERVVYLGGVAPSVPTSQHLESRRATGQILRDRSLLVLELRAAMIIGKGSISFNLIRDLAVRLPVVALPPWLDRGSYPIAIDDVAYAIVRGLDVNLAASACHELPGPEWITHRQLLARVSALLGTHIIGRRLTSVSTGIAARILGLISREPYPVVAELVAGLPSDLTPRGVSFWTLIGEAPVRSIMSAILDALADETSQTEPSNATQERLVRRVRQYELLPT